MLDSSTKQQARFDPISYSMAYACRCTGSGARVAAPENNDQAWWQRIIRNASTADNDQGSTFKLDRRWTARAEVGDVKEHLGVPWLSVLVPLGLAQIIDLKSSTADLIIEQRLQPYHLEPSLCHRRW